MKGHRGNSRHRFFGVSFRFFSRFFEFGKPAILLASMACVSRARVFSTLSNDEAEYESCGG